MRFADTIGFPTVEAAPFYERVVKSLADIFESPGGLLLVPDDEGRLVRAGALELGDGECSDHLRHSQTDAVL